MQYRNPAIFQIHANLVDSKGCIPCDSRMESLGELVKRLRNEKGLSQGAVAAFIGATDQSISDLEVGRTSALRGGGGIKYKKLAELFEVPVKQIIDALRVETSPAEIGGEPEAPTRTSFQPLIVGQVPANGMIEMFEDGGELERVPMEMPDHPTAFAFRIVGDCMAPEFLPGDVIICEPIDASNIQPGDDVCVWCDGGNDGRSTFKRVERIVKGVMHLRPLNPEHPSLKVKLEHIARAAIQFTLVRNKRRA